MGNSLPPRNERDLEGLLRQAHAALDRGDVQAGREASQAILRAAEASGHRRFEARALLCLAHCDRMLSRYRRAHRASQRAAQLCQLLGDTSGEVQALTTHAFVSINLGRNEEAVEAALLAVRLSQSLDRDDHLLLSYNALGVAYYWCHSFEKAEQALGTAIEIGEAAKPPLSTFQTRVHLWWTEVIRQFYERYFVGAFGDLAPLTQLREDMVSRLAGHAKETDGSGTQVTTEAVLLFGLALDQIWNGRIAQATLDVEALATWARRYGMQTWLTALEYWVRAEIAWAQQDWPAALDHAARMTGISVEVEHEQLACLGHLLASQLYVAQGLNGEGLDQLRRLRLREQLIRSDSLETRERVIEWQVNLRQREQSIQRLEVTSRQLERLSLEDALTGIPNRRHFEQHATELLRSSQRGIPPCVALIDVDQFKQVNDRFSHQVGDAVLKRIAQVLKSHIREEDMAARLAGDEFVIVFKNAELRVAQQVCARIQNAVRNQDWDQIAAGLTASISVGVAAATPGDSVDSLTHRADAAMYQEKRRRPSAP